MTEFFGLFFQHKSIVVGAIKNVTLRRILLVLVLLFLPEKRMREKRNRDRKKGSL